ncbi:MAG: hypothetical protein IJY18_02405 [Clostridia bacterium]|nr:hypothetical protein [Clostridia bacterium]
MQGDIVAVYGGDGTQYVYYAYDAWGFCTATYYNSGDLNAAYNNPFRYRGYYFDKDLYMYCVGTRYYDYYTGRWVNADTPSVITATPTALTDKNLYAYCDNNPVSRADYGGEFWNWLVGGVVGAVGGMITASMQGKTGDEFWGSVANGAISGAVAGIAADVILVTGGTAAVVMLAGAAGGLIGSGLGSATEDLIVDQQVNLGDVFVDAVLGAATGALMGAVSGPQKSMMETVKASAGKKALDRGINIFYAIKKTFKKETMHLPSSFLQEGLSNFTSWFASETVKSYWR